MECKTINRRRRYRCEWSVRQEIGDEEEEEEEENNKKKKRDNTKE
jgi:hypothetical protein